MSRLTKLIAQVGKTDAALARDLRREVEVLSSRRPFGLNFERHVPESVRLPNRKLRRGDKVVFRDGASDGATWVIAGFEGKGADRKVRLVQRGPSDDPETTVAPASALVVVAEFRDAIYPGLQSIPTALVARRSSLAVAPRRATPFPNRFHNPVSSSIRGMRLVANESNLVSVRQPNRRSCPPRT